ncbi:SLOG family protein [Sediminibacillus massiliensis]|uniref:SLOG family protein n=1 Tax=Sediminibacillus massiliensis TaxID=1926277 RepID=UPI0009886085|nr:SLOG family protein [Sediminibacillus massiliensis]
MKILTVTGYKPMEMNIFKQDDKRIEYIKAAIKKKIISFIEEGLEWVLISGQMGVELWAGQVVQELQDTYDIKLGIIPPFEDQDQRWPDSLKMIYEELVLQADFHQPIYHGGYKGPYQFKAKNQWLVEKSDGCVILLNEEFPGSTRFFYDVAASANQKNGYPIYLITPMELEEIVNDIQMENPEHWD